MVKVEKKMKNPQQQPVDSLAFFFFNSKLNFSF